MNIQIEIRDDREVRILSDGLGNVCELSFPINTPEEIWTRQINAIKLGPPDDSSIEFKTITPRQIRMALLMSGYSLEDISNAISSIPDSTQRQLAQVEWEYAVDFERHNPLVESIGQAIGLSSAQIDSLWGMAMNI